VRVTADYGAHCGVTPGFGRRNYSDILHTWMEEESPAGDDFGIFVE
jgi:hypothetical protein